MTGNKTVEILNLPGYTPSYYMLGFEQAGMKIKVKPTAEFAKYNFGTCIIFRYNNKLIVLDNDDPHRVIEELYEKADYYFMTNKALNKPDFQREKIFPLFPHYPVNCVSTYIKYFGKHVVKPSHFKKALVVFYTVYTRPKYVNYTLDHKTNKYVFFVARIWQRETVANAWRIAFIDACAKIKGLQFEGGFRTRKDEQYPEGVEQYVNTRTYNPPEFSKKTLESIVVFNNPAVKGAISWRLAEYLNASKAMISVPFEMELPVPLKDHQETMYVNEPAEMQQAVLQLVEDDTKRAQLERNAKSYFDTYCTPKAQIIGILEKCLA